MLTPSTLHRIYRISAWYDCLVTWPYATPITLSVFWALLDTAHTNLSLAPLPALGVYGVLFANFFGSVVLIWSVVRLRLNNVRLARYDAVGRWLFSAAMLHALWNGASPLVAVFLVIELCFAVLQSLPTNPSGATD